MKVEFKFAMVTALVTTSALANPRALPMTYTTDTRPEGTVELEQYIDMTPLRALSPSTMKEVSYLASAFQTEIEIGLLDRLELGLYLTYVPTFGDAYTGATAPAGTGTGMKQRLKYLLADPDAWPIDVGIYGELAENEHEIEFEAKLLLQRRFGDLRVAANLSAEVELTYTNKRELIINPSLGVTYPIARKIQLGVEGWVHGELEDEADFAAGPHAYVGPAVLFELGKLWWAVGAYTRVTEPSHDLVPGEPYGRLWFRSIVGYDL